MDQKLKKIILLLSFFLFLIVDFDTSAAVLTQLRVVKQAHHCQFIFNARGKLKVHSQVRNNPRQLIIYVNQARGLKFFDPRYYKNTPVRSMSWENASAQNIKIIFWLNQPVGYKISAINSVKGSRLIVSFFSANKKMTLAHAPVKKRWQRRPAKTNKFTKLASRSSHQSHSTPKNSTHLYDPVLDTPVAEDKFVQPEEAPWSNAPQSNKNIVIVIDAGHGGKDPGTSGPRGTHEKNVVLSIAKRLYQIANQQPGYKAILTRDGDYYLTLRQRLAFARRYHADMFIAIHADAAFHNQYASGASIYALSLRGATSEAARWLAARENASELAGVKWQGEDSMLKSVLINLSQTATIQSSLVIGTHILQYLSSVTRLHYHRIEQAAFVVLKSPDIPSLLVETGFLTNPNEERRLNNSRYQYQLAYSIMQGIHQYFSARKKG